MSEYQYYEFMAVDGPISDEGLRYARGCSSRAEVSRLSWRNVYHFRSFKGSEASLLKHYDAHAREGKSARFQEQLTAFRERYRRRPGVLSRIKGL